jgi:hypothetical protein
MPWAADVEELVDALVVDNLGDTLLRDKLAVGAEHRAAVAAAIAEVDKRMARLTDLSDEELAHRGPLLTKTCGAGYSGDWHKRDERRRAMDAELQRRKDAAASPSPHERAPQRAQTAAVLAEHGRGARHCAERDEDHDGCVFLTIVDGDGVQVLDTILEGDGRLYGE